MPGLSKWRPWYIIPASKIRSTGGASVDISRAFAFAFEDEDWIGKITITVIVTWLALVPLLGLIAVAALLGYALELVQNVRAGHPRPLPQWANYDDKIARGGNVLAAFILYNLPNILASCCYYTLTSFAGNTSEGGTITLGFGACVLPLLLVYNLVATPMLALGMVRFTEQNRLGVFFEFDNLFSTLRGEIRLITQWFLSYLLVGMVLLLLGLIPCIGWIAAPALAVPVQGYLLGQFARQLSGRVRIKPKRLPRTRR